MEWLSQTRRISKSIDQICMNTIDGVIRVLPLIDRKTINDNEDFFNKFCVYYHKLNPVSLIRKVRKKYPCHSCKRGKVTVQDFDYFIRGSIDRCRSGLDIVRIQWFEIIDFMHDRPEMVNPNVIDEYIINQINIVCQNNVKVNPFESGTSKRFGKFWKDEDGKWKSERRNRF